MAIQVLQANLSLSTSINPNRKILHILRSKLFLRNTHLYTNGMLLRVVGELDHLIHFAPPIYINKLAPDTFEFELQDIYLRLNKGINKLDLITYDLADNTQHVSESFND